ncbi:MAG: hypothetical protein IBJ11_07755 [Phycisphaerales bacterium]|nr:hypothetical protein [Phycisphaerales bacterium]
MADPAFHKRPAAQSDKPRRVRGGVRLARKDWPEGIGWQARRWLDALTARLAPDTAALGIDYARKGQARSLALEPGRVVAAVQGHVYTAYRTVIEVPTFGEAQWEALVQAMAEQAIHGAKLLSGELTLGLEDLFGQLGLRLLPATAELRGSCTCAEGRAAGEGSAWCKHVACAGLLAAEALDRDPFLVFTLRGVPGPEVLERLTERRSKLAGGGPGGTASNGMAQLPALDEQIDEFWDSGPGLDDLETPIRKPEVSHALLRRLGPSPFADAKFPLVGLLATCYDTISRAAQSEGFAGPAGGGGGAGESGGDRAVESEAEGEAEGRGEGGGAGGGAGPPAGGRR